MRQSISLSGQKFGMLLVLSEAPKRGNDLFVNCICDCGKETVVQKGHLKNGHTKSCGCQVCTLPVHGMRNTPEYKAWVGMRERCYKKDRPNFHLYGGRGITVCDRWQENFENFFLDMGLKPSPAHSLDRFPDKDGNYEPSNCRWATPHEQTRNQRTNRWIEWGGEKLILQDWANKLGISGSGIHKRIATIGNEKAYEYYRNKYPALINAT